MSIPCPTETADGMNMSRYNLGDAARQKIPNHYAAIIAAHRQKSSVLIEGTGHC